MAPTVKYNKRLDTACVVHYYAFSFTGTAGNKMTDRAKELSALYGAYIKRCQDRSVTGMSFTDWMQTGLRKLDESKSRDLNQNRERVRTYNQRQAENGMAKVCVGLAAVSFLMAVVTVFTGPMLAPAEAYSRASTNLALLALCLFIGFSEGESTAA